MTSLRRAGIAAGMIVMILGGRGTRPAGAAPAQGPAPPALTSTTSLSLGVSWANLDVDGNLRRFEQYVTPPHGVYLGELGLQHGEAGGKTLLDLRLRDVGEPSRYGDLWASLGKGAVVVRALQRHSSFYRDWDDPSSVSDSRRDGRYDVTVPSGRGEFRASYREVRWEPLGGEGDTNWRNSFTGLRYAGHAGNWQGGLSYDNEKFASLNGGFLNGSADTTTLRVVPPTGDRTFLEGNASITDTSLDERRFAPRYYRQDLGGGQILSDDLALFGNVNHYNISRSIAQTAFSHNATGGQLAAEYRGLWHTTITVGGGARQVDFTDDEGTMTTDTNLRTLQAKLVTRFNRGLKLKASSQQWWASDRPIAFSLHGKREGALDWSSKTDQKAELSYNPNWRSGVTATWHELKWEHSDFGERNSLIDKGLFGWWLPQEKLTLYATVMWQDFGLVAPTSLGGDFVTDDHTWVVGGSYQFSAATMADLSYTRARSTGALETDEKIWTAGLSHKWRSGDRLSANVVQDSYRTSESTPDIDFGGNRYEIRFTKAALWRSPEPSARSQASATPPPAPTPAARPTAESGSGQGDQVVGERPVAGGTAQPGTDR